MALLLAGMALATTAVHAQTPTVPGAPTALTATATGPSRINLAWTAPTSTGGADITGYKIEVSTDGGTNWANLVADTDATTTTYSHTGLIVGSARHYRVSAINSAGTGAASSTATETTNVLVRNTGQGSDTSDDRNADLSQLFTTGSDTGGYTLTSIEIVSEDAQGHDFTAEIWDVDTSGEPKDKVARLTAPTSFAAGTLTFTAPTDTVLAANTTYALRVSLTLPGRVTYDATTADNEDAGAASGWSIANSYDYEHSINGWQEDDEGRSLRFAVRAVSKADASAATLGTLTVSPRDIPGFASDRTSYEFDVASTVRSVSVSALTDHSSAAAVITPTDANMSVAGHQVRLSLGANTITVAVTAADGMATNTYTVIINRIATTWYGWKVTDDRATNFEGDSVRAIWSDGTTAWVVGKRFATIYAYHLSNGQRDPEKDMDNCAAGNLYPSGIWSDGTTMWISDSATDKIYAYRMSDQVWDKDKDINNLVGDFPIDIWSDGSTMWVLDVFDDKIYAYNMSTRSRDPSKDFDTLAAAGNERANGLWSDGTTMWVTDYFDDKVYAYKMSNKSRDSAKDFNALGAAGNDLPTGLWSDGTTMWVGDRRDQKLYSYNNPLYATTAAADGTSLVITFNRDPASASLANSAFTVKKTPEGGSETTVGLTGSPAISGKTVTLTLSAAVVAADTGVKVSYAKPTTGSSNKLADANGIEVPSFTDLRVANAASTAPPNNLATGAPVISGRAQVDETLTAGTDGISDIDGISGAMFNYQWLADDVDIVGATASSYGPTDQDVGKAITVTVTFIDDLGAEELLTSAATRRVLARPVIAPDSAAVDGDTLTLTFNETLDETPGGLAPASAFTVHVGSAAGTVSAVSVMGYTVTLTLESAVSRADTVTVDYARPTGTEFIRDTLGRIAGSFTGQAVTNNTAPPPLTASAHDAPASHGGISPFTFELRFSEEVPISHKTLRDHAFTVTGGEVVNARPLEQGQNIRWEMTIRPDGNAGVTVVLPATTDCAAQGAICIGGDRKLSGELTVTITGVSVFEAPAAPGSPTVTTVTGTTSLSVSWTAPARAGRPEVTSYDVRYREGADGDWTDGPQDRTGATATITGLSSGVMYQVQVRATNDQGDSDWSASGSATANTTDNNAPVFSSPTASRSVAENTAAGQNVGAAVTATDADTLTYTLGGPDAASFGIVSGSGQIRTRAPLDHETKPSYTVTVTATDTSNATATVTVTITITDIGPSVSAARPTVIPTGSNSLLVSWPASSGAVESYDIQYRPVHNGALVNGPGWEGHSWADGPQDVTGTSAPITGLRSRTLYVVHVRATDGEGDSSWSTYSSGRTRAPGANNAPVFSPSTVSRSVAEGTAAGRNVGAAVTATGDGTLTYSLSGADAASFDIVSGSGQIRTRAALNHETKSSHTVTVVASDGTESSAATVTITVTDVSEPPAAPGQPTVTAVTGTTSLSVSWTAPDNAGKPDIIGYGVRYREGADGDWTDGPEIRTGVTATIAGLMANTMYQAQVRATNDEGDSDWSAGGSATTSAPPNTSATGAPTISGTAQVGQTLTVSTTGIADADGLTSVSYAYQWVRNDGTDDADISGATGSSYTLVSADQGKTIKVRVSFTDDAGNAESLTSTASAAIDPATSEQKAANTPATGAPAISGTAQVGETLTASTTGIADEDGLTNVSYAYQWVRNDGTDDADISRATGSSYTPVAADVGETIKVRVSFTDDAGNAESLTSTATTEIDFATSQQRAANTPATGAPAISGTAQVGETLTTSTTGIADEDGLTSVSYAYQWVGNDGTDDSDISGATASAYTPVAADRGKTIKVRVSFTDDAGNAESLTSAGTASVAAPTPVLTAGAHDVPASHDGSASFTFELRFSEKPTDSFSYRTLRNHAFTVTGGEVVQARRLDRPANVRWEITVRPSGNGDVTVVLPATTDCAATGAICTGDDRKLSDDLTVTVAGPPTDTPATGAPTISGTAQVGETLTASTSGIADSDGLTGASFSYQWLADDSDISGATSSSYTLTDSDQGNAIKVRVSFTDDEGNAESLTSAATAAVGARPNIPATGMASIRGTVRVGETLTALIMDVADSDGLTGASFSYQWLADDSDISGATGSSYTLTDSEQGKTIRMRVSFTDDAGNAESLTSPATGSVAAAWVLTASAHYAPASHDGSSTFMFQLRFSEEPRSDFSYRTLRDHAFSVAGGQVIKAQRLLRPGNTRWGITISPDGAGTVTIVLPATTDCDTDGAICTGDGRKLSNRLEITVSGPGE